ncbi:gp581 [Bacillus phage G]|uniref:Gp581 n=1 Tax=Bacillus phage G TaxID=2884420 RepID=G3MAW1_9CAUD|nr:gp581 [Bacillus phage G]AEO93826.1 gp581 [Bacillus phage G]
MKKEIADLNKNLIETLFDLKKSVYILGHLWSSHDGSGVTRFDSILGGDNYPFKQPFFEVCSLISAWVNNAIEKLGGEIKEIDINYVDNPSNDDMIEALKKTYKVFFDLSILWDSASMLSERMEEILNEEYHLNVSFPELENDVHYWVFNSVDSLRELDIC